MIGADADLKETPVVLHNREFVVRPTTCSESKSYRSISKENSYIELTPIKQTRRSAGQFHASYSCRFNHETGKLEHTETKLQRV